METKALGLVEVAGLAPAIETCDIMVKTASVTVVEIENTKGGGYTVIKVEGDVGAVNAACKAGEAYAVGIDKLVSVKVIPRPATGTKDFFAKEEFDRPVLYRK
jgi:microcompartment protein CcmL/EutN